MEKTTTRTFETRIRVDSLTDEALHECTQLFSHIQHRLFADISSGKKAGELKNDYLACYEITARQFNAQRVLIEGKIASIKALRMLQMAERKERISSLEKSIKRLAKTKADKKLLHNKKRRLASQKAKLHELQEDHKKGIVRCCFGTKKLFHAQFNLEENGYTSHEEWLKSWRKARSKEIFFLGSKDETGGNQTCTATLQPDQTLKLRIRMPDTLAKKYGKYVCIPSLDFTYGKEEIVSLLQNKQTMKAISWRFVHDTKGWRLFMTFDVACIPVTSRKKTGVIGLDINTDHLALVETDRYGNPLSKHSIPYNLYGKNSDQARAIIGDATAQAIDYAERACKPLIMEELDFQKKKTELREKNRHSHSRMLSSFAYSSLITHLQSRAMKQGVLIQQVNPAYTSIIGRVKFAKRYGLSVHQAAALTIGRRYLCYSEKVPSNLSKIPDGKEGHVTLSLPVRNRDKHVWSLWRHLSKELQTALAAHFRTTPKSIQKLVTTSF